MPGTGASVPISWTLLREERPRAADRRGLGHRNRTGAGPPVTAYSALSNPSQPVHEAEGLAALGGQGAVEVYAIRAPGAGPVRRWTGRRYRHHRHAARAVPPGTQLRGRPEAEQHVVITDLLRSVWAVELPSDHPFRPLSAMADDWVLRAEDRIAADPGRLDAGLARDGLALFRELSRTGPTEVLLFTDLHAGNVLSGQRRPWLLIDPKPYVGDPHYDVLQHLLNCNASLQADPIGLLTEVADLASLDAERVRQWLFARCVQEILSQGSPWPALDVVCCTGCVVCRGRTPLTGGEHVFDHF